MKLHTRQSNAPLRTLSAGTLLALMLSLSACPSAEKKGPGERPRSTTPKLSDHSGSQITPERAGPGGNSAFAMLELLEIDSGKTSWVEREDPGSRCRVLIVAANEAAKPQLGLDAALPSATALKTAFASVGIRPDDIKIMKGAEVSMLGEPSKLERSIKEVSKDLTGAGDSLILIWIGHGKHYDGDLKMVTSDTDSKNGRLTATLGARELAEYLQ
ncbi:MAG: hypothetical protein ACI835_005583, partial [Planctomycetota bacterium]